VDETPFRYFNSSSKFIRLPVVMSVRYPLSLWQGEGMLFVRGINIPRDPGPPGLDLRLVESFRL
jgi:hypothetical protein